MNFMNKTLLISLALATAGISTAQDALPASTANNDRTWYVDFEFIKILQLYQVLQDFVI